MPATFYLLFKRNVKMEFRLWRRYCFELLVVIIILSLILTNPVTQSRLLLNTKLENDGNTVDSHALQDIGILSDIIETMRLTTKYLLAYTPVTTFTSSVMSAVSSTLRFNETKGFDTAKHLEQRFDDRRMLAAVIFYDLQGDDPPKNLSIAIRFPYIFRSLNSIAIKELMWVTRCTGVITADDDHATDSHMKQDIYIREGFLQLQQQVFKEWFEQIKNIVPTSYEMPDVLALTVPMKNDGLLCALIGSFELPTYLFNILYLLSFLNVLRNVGLQLQHNNMVHQWHYGYTFTTQWLCLYCVFLARLMFSSLLIVASSFIIWSFERGVFDIKILVLMLIFIYLLTTALILTAFLYAKIFPNGINCLLLGAVTWQFSYGIFVTILDHYWNAKNYYVIFILISYFNNLTYFGMQLFQRAIYTGINIKEMCMLFGSTVACTLIVLLLLVALQYRWPGYLLSYHIVAKKVPKLAKDQPNRLSFTHNPSWYNFEFGDVGSVQVLRLRHICTMHSKSRQKILKDVSLRLYLGEIFVLLGHIGAGKLTLLRVMCGLKYPVVGSVLIDDVDFHAAAQTKRPLIDFRSDRCGLPPFLTVQQTIRYYVQLKQQQSEAWRETEEINKWLTYLDPYIRHRNMQLGKLSSSVRYLISYCCAMATGTKIIVLDEPTKQLSHREAKAFWAIVMNEKAERVFLITTCNYNEAERVADRIGILSRGVLEASGTPFFLRAKFSNNVELVLIKKPHVPDDPITEFLNDFIPGIEPDNEIGDTLSYKIDGELRPQLQRMLIHLENNRKKLGIEHVRVVGADMSDIYMKLVTVEQLRHQILPANTRIFKYAAVPKEQLRKQQFRAVFLKKLMLSKLSAWPLTLYLGSWLLLVLIGCFAQVLNAPGSYVSGEHMGYRFNNDVWLQLPNINHCGYIEIQTQGKTFWHNNENFRTHTLDSRSITCRPDAYLDDVKAGKIKMSNLGAVELDSKNHKLMAIINQNAFHAAPAVLNVLQNLILRQAFPNDTDIVYRADNHPMPMPIYLNVNVLENEVAHIYITVAIGCVMPLIVSVFILPVVEEHKEQVRELQLIAGLALDIYWMVCYLMDAFTFFIYSIIYVMIMYMFEIGHFTGFECVLMVLLLTMYGLAALPMTYLVAMFVNSSKIRAFLASVLLQGLTGVFLHTLYWNVFKATAATYSLTALLPGHSLLIGFSKIHTHHLEEAKCQKLCEIHSACSLDNITVVLPNCDSLIYLMWSNPGILPSLICMLMAAFCVFFAITWIELRRKENLFYMHTKRLHKLHTACFPFDDADVADVKVKIADADLSKCKQSVFLVDQVEDRIPRVGNSLHTVSFAVNKYLSMGIYGLRNSGKTHLARQLVGLDGFSFGEIYVRGMDIKYDLSKVHDYVGYCPQRGGLLGNLTPRQLILLFCMIRGVPETSIREKTHYLSLMLNMADWMNRKCSQLTPEKRRKLNIALSLVAFNKIVVLDEPTYGMPASTCREIWNVLRYMRFCGKTVIFTSNNELECKVLSDFIILFHQSEMLAIGSTAYLCFKYSYGFYVEVRLIREGATIEESEANLRKDLKNLSRFIRFLHEKSEIVGRLQNWFKYYVPVGNIVYSYLYGAMEKNKVRLNLADYTIYQANMNNIVSQVLETRANLKQRYTTVLTAAEEREQTI